MMSAQAGENYTVVQLGMLNFGGRDLIGLASSNKGRQKKFLMCQIR